jgi:hypothetical protein
LPAATIWVDGKAIGKSPMQLTLAAGEHYVAATLPGHVAQLQRVRVEKDKASAAPFSLLSRLPAEEEARSLRTALVAPDDTAPSTDDYSRVAVELAGVASLDLVVLVRSGDQGKIEAAIYDVRKAKLAAWVDASKEKLVLAELPHAAEISLPTPKDVAAKRVGDGGPLDGTIARKEPPWYWTRQAKWIEAIGGATVVVIGAIVLATASGTSKQLNDFTFGGFN